MKTSGRIFFPVAAAVVLATGLYFFINRPADLPEPVPAPVFILVREFHTHLLPPGAMPLPVSTAHIDTETPKLTLPAHLWQEWRPGALVLLRRLEHLDQVLAEQLVVSARREEGLDLASWPSLAGYDAGGRPQEWRPAGSGGLAGSTLAVHLADSSSASVSYRELEQWLRPGETAYWYRSGADPWRVAGPREAAEPLAAAVEAGKPLTAVIVTNLGPWPAEAFVPAGGL